MAVACDRSTPGYDHRQPQSREEPRAEVVQMLTAVTRFAAVGVVLSSLVATELDLLIAVGLMHNLLSNALRVVAAHRSQWATLIAMEVDG